MKGAAAWFGGALGAALLACAGGAAPLSFPPAAARTAGAVPGEAAARFLLVGDTGTGDRRARRVAAALGRHAGRTGASHVFFLGDNVYEEGEARLIGPRYLDVYGELFAAGLTPHAALGNHDVLRCRGAERRPLPRDASAYLPASDCWVEDHLATAEFGYRDGFRYYSVEIHGSAEEARRGPLVEVFVLDTNTLGAAQAKVGPGVDEPQRRWLGEALGRSRALWRVVAMHHPLVAPERCRWLVFGCRGDDAALRAELEPIFLEHGVDAVFQAHQHLYARLEPRHGIHYFVTGAGGKHADSFRPDPRTVPRADRGAFNHFMAVEATEERFRYAVVDAAGNLRDEGGFGRRGAAGPGPGSLAILAGR